MEVRFDDFGIFNIDERYLKYLYGVDSEVYYSPDRYDRKPFLGITVGIGSYTYFIPFSSAKPKHLKWRNVTPDHYLIYEIVDRKTIPKNAVCRPLKGKKVMHILAALDMKKMIPVPENLYTRVDIGKVPDFGYRKLMEKEFDFCLGIRDGILDRVREIYEDQTESGIVRTYYCDFKRLEKACDEYMK